MQWFNPPNYLAPVEAPGSPLLGSLAGDLSAAGLTTEPVDAGQIRKKAFLKAILNAGLSALCASSGITMRQAMTWPHTRALAARLVREGLGVAAAEGFHYGDEALETCMCYLDQGGDHMPSMWYDLANKTRTEIDYINGQIARIGLAREGVDVRANVLIASLVVTQEIKSGARAPNDIPEYLTHD
jgi:2-dehydropantoate 2-reductase